jgi:hypothetical protein
MFEDMMMADIMLNILTMYRARYVDNCNNIIYMKSNSVA